MQRKRRRPPAPPAATARIAESPDPAAPALPAASLGVRYDADELFPEARPLSVREREALELLANGKPNAVIASVMGNSKRTVENHISKILEKLNVADRIEAMALYHQAIEAKQERRIAELLARVDVLEKQNAALRRQHRGRG